MQYQTEWLKNFLLQARDDRERVDFRMIYVDMAGDLQAGLLLSQIVYWHLPSKSNKSKLRVFKDGHYWIAKTRYGWWEEIRLSPRQIDRAIEGLRNAGLVKTKIHRFNGNPTIHIRLCMKQFEEVYRATQNSERKNPWEPKTETPLSPSREMDIVAEGTSLTETTTETTSIPIDGVPSIAPGGEIPFSDPREKPAVITKQKVPVKKKRRRDPRLDHPAIRAVKEAKDTVRNPPKGTWDVLIKTIGDEPDVVKLKQCWTEWCLRGYNTASYKWVTDWYVGGIKGKMTKQENAGNWRLEW